MHLIFVVVVVVVVLSLELFLVLFTMGTKFKLRRQILHHTNIFLLFLVDKIFFSRTSSPRDFIGCLFSSNLI